jgi:DNA-binding helix-hairpin-helix protein with protein kinase domain
MATLFDAAGTAVVTGREIGRGGEGAVFEIPNSPDQVAKVYHAAVSKEKQTKLATMSAIASPEMARVAAWPLRTIHSSRGGSVVGFVMPSVSSWPDIHCLYSPVERKRRFPEVRWSFLIHAARNAASAFDTLHRHGIVVGDVNQSNLVVNPRSAEVRLVDCDSFQVTANGMTHLCEVGIAHFTPPELQGIAFRGMARTPNHDAFGLAVLAFHMLVMGRHPFAGRFLGASDMPIERAITEYRFAYGDIAQQRQMLPPPDTLPFACVGPAVAKLFDAAFAESSRAQRPTPAQWISALETLERNLQRCPTEPTHEFHAGVARCPWCDLEARSVFYFIGLVARQVTSLPFDLAAAWAAITRIPRPEPPSLPSSVHVASAAPVSAMGRHRRAFGQIPVWVIAAAACVVVGGGGGYGAAIAAVLCTLYLVARFGSRDDRVLRAALGNAEKEWREVARRLGGAVHAQVFDTKLAELQRARDECLRLHKAQQAELEQLEASKRDTQLRAFLERFRIDAARISGIGPSRAATLASYGIETAADLDRWRIQAVPGFGEKRSQDLLAWRATLESRFVFNATTQVPESAKAAVRRKFERPLHAVQTILRNGADVLDATRRDVVRAHEMLASEAARIAAEYARAKSALSFQALDTVPLPEVRSAARPTAPRPPIPSTAPQAPPYVPGGTPNPTCPRCGKVLLPRRGRRGPFWGCSGYPRCRYTRNR